MAKITVFDVGYCTHPACIAVRGAGFGVRKFPARAYLIETRSGCYLWDTGYSTHFETCAKGVYAPYKWVTPVHFEDQTENLTLQLARIGLSSTMLRGILVSHYHADHIAGLRDFPRVPLWSSQEALEAIVGLRGLRALTQAFIPSLLPDDFASRIRTYGAADETPLPDALSPFHRGWRLEGSDEVIIVPLPGHAKGHVGAFVQTDAGWILLGSDAAWAPESYQTMVGPSDLSFLIQDDRKAYYETLHALHCLHHKGVKILLSHA